MLVDDKGYRLNVGIILTNAQCKLFWGQRVQLDAWQFPQGGLLNSETPMDGMYRELYEETGLHKDDVEVIAESSNWYSYELPKQFIRNHQTPVVIGQKQKWFLLRLLSSDDQINLTRSEKPEFANWTWVDYWSPIDEVIYFKQEVYKAALNEFAANLEI